MYNQNIGEELVKELEYSMKNHGIVNEAYVGKTPNLLKAEQAMVEIYNFIKKRERKKATGKVMNQKCYKDLVKYLSDEFQISNFQLIFSDGISGGIYNGKPMSANGPMNVVGATSIPVLSDIKNIIKNIAFKSGKSEKISGVKSVCIFMDSTLVTSYGLKPDELMGVLLHEIGHSFDMSLITTMFYICGFIYSPIIILNQTWSSFFASRVFVTTAKIMNKVMPEFLTRLIRKINNMITPIMQQITPQLYIMGFMKQIQLLLFNPNLSMDERNNLLSSLIFRTLSGYADERYSDSFASTFGYGYGLSSALRKLTYMGDNTEKSIVKGYDTTSFDILSALGSMLVSTLDPHPATTTRVKNQISKLKRDLDKVSDPRLKKEIKNQINEIQYLYDNYYGTKNNTSDMNKYRAMLDKMFKGDDWQSLLFEPFLRTQEL